MSLDYKVTEEQEKALKELEDAYNKCISLDILFWTDEDPHSKTQEVHAVNRKNIDYVARKCGFRPEYEDEIYEDIDCEKVYKIKNCCIGNDCRGEAGVVGKYNDEN
jgi:hypothetical protein